MHDIFRSRVIFLVPIFCWKAEGDVSLGFGAGVAGLGFVLPRGPGSGEGAVANKGSPPLLSGVELGGWSRSAWYSIRTRMPIAPLNELFNKYKSTLAETVFHG